MTNFLIKLFIKDSGDKNRPEVRARYGSLASTVGIAVNLLLAAAKLTVGLLSASLSVTADALNNLSDAGSSVISFIGFKLSSKPADKQHPFGHARMEYIASMIVSFIILLVGAQLFKDSLKTIIRGGEEPAALGTSTFIILSLSVVAKIWLSFFCKRIARIIDSTAVRASGTDALSDAASTSAVLISAVIIKLTGFYLLDAIMGLALSLVIIYAGIKILNETKNSILGESPCDKIAESISKITAEYSDVIGIHDMMIHNYGPKHFVASFHAEVDGSGDVFKLHDTIDCIERRISTELGIICTVHMDPIDTRDETVTRLKTLLCDVISQIYPTVTVHDFRVVSGDTHTNMIFDIVIPFEEKTKPEKIADDIRTAVSERDTTLFCVITVDRA